MNVADISDLSSPRRLNANKRMSVGNGNRDIDVTGRTGFLVVGESNVRPITGGLATIDLFDPETLPVLGFLQLPKQSQAIVTVNRVAYVYSVDTLGDQYPAMTLSVVDVSDDRQPKSIGRLDLTRLDLEGWATVISSCQGNSGRRRNLLYRNGYLYAGAASQGVFIIDVREPKNPKLVKYLPTVCDSQLAFAGDRLLSVGRVYRGSWTDAQQGIQVVDISRPEEARSIGWWTFETTGKAQLVFRRGDTLHVLMESELQNWDVTNPVQPKVIGRSPVPPLQTLRDAGKQPHVGQLLYADNTLFIPNGDDGPPGRQSGGHGVSLVDVTDDTAPRYVTTLPSKNKIGQKVASWRDWLLVPTANSVAVYDLAHPGVIVTQLDLGFEARDLEIVGDKVHVVGRVCSQKCEGWLRSYKLATTPDGAFNATSVARLSLGEDTPLLIAGRGNYLYVPVTEPLAFRNFHLVIDIADPAAPRVIHRDPDMVQPVSLDVVGPRYGFRWGTDVLHYLVGCPYGGPGCAGFFDLTQPDRPVENQYDGLQLGARDRDEQDGLIFQVDPGGKVEVAQVVDQTPKPGTSPTPYPTAGLPRIVFVTTTPTPTPVPTNTPFWDWKTATPTPTKGIPVPTIRPVYLPSVFNTIPSPSSIRSTVITTDRSGRVSGPTEIN